MLKTVTSQFTAEAKRLGATIVASETYDSSSDDLSKQFLAIRKAGLSSEPQVSFERKVNKTLKRKMVMEGANPELLDSLIEAHGRISVNKLFGKNGLRKAEALNLKIIVPRKVSEQNTDVPATSIQALFAPVVASEDIGIIASQMTYYNIKTQLLGSSEWYDEAQLETQKRYCNGAIFCSDYYLDEEDPSIIAMQQQLKKKPTNYTLFGYDAMKLVLSCIGDGATTREKLHESLSNTQNWHGLHSTITLKGGRVNRVIEILQYKNSDVKRVAEITVEK